MTTWASGALTVDLCVVRPILWADCRRKSCVLPLAQEVNVSEGWSLVQVEWR